VNSHKLKFMKCINIVFNCNNLLLMYDKLFRLAGMFVTDGGGGATANKMRNPQASAEMI
jgi:hypothetical protein